MISLDPRLELDASHVYSFNDKPVVSVTQVLYQEGLIDARFFPRDGAALRRGTIVHRLAELDTENDLDEDGIPTDFRGYLQAIRAFKLEMGWTTELRGGRPLAEVRMYDESLGLAGTADEIGHTRGTAGLWLVDFKTGLPSPATALQTAAYAGLYLRATTDPIVHRGAVELRENGSYRLHQYRDPFDLNVFLAALRLNAWRREHLAGLAESKEAAA